MSKHVHEADAQVNWVELTKVANDIEFNMVAELLKMAEIPALKKVKGIDGFVEIMIGVPITGISVMVPEDKYEEALQLLNAPVDEQEIGQENE